MLKSVKSESSTSLKVKYQFMDPFGVLGTAYLEIHEASKLPASLTAVYENNNEQYNNYWGAFDSRNRVSLSTYEDSYTFTGLKPGTIYYVALAHMTQIGDATERTLDDYYKISTITPRNSLSVSTVKSNSVEFVLQLESLNSGAAEVQLDRTSETYTLTSDDIKTAVSRGLSGVISVDKIEDLKKIVLKVVDEEGNVLLTTQCNNSFYKEPTSGTPGGASGGTGTPVITTPSAPSTSTGTSTGAAAAPGGGSGGPTTGESTTGGATSGSAAGEPTTGTSGGTSAGETTVASEGLE